VHGMDRVIIEKAHPLSQRAGTSGCPPEGLNLSLEQNATITFGEEVATYC
jgi:hypothetical protein